MTRRPNAKAATPAPKAQLKQAEEKARRGREAAGRPSPNPRKEPPKEQVARNLNGSAAITGDASEGFIRAERGSSDGSPARCRFVGPEERAKTPLTSGVTCLPASKMSQTTRLGTPPAGVKGVDALFQPVFRRFSDVDGTALDVVTCPSDS
jgi:hypothetical protein